jgi:hypothetical protein
MNFYQEKLNAIKIALGMQVVEESFEAVLLEDGVTKIEAESFEVGKTVYVVSEAGDKAIAPEGSHTLEDGTKVTLDAAGVITAIEKPEPKESEVEVVIEAAAEDVPPTGDIVATPEVEEMKKMVMQCMAAIEDVAKEVAIVKEEMASYKSKMEKMSKTPADKKISTFNTEATPDKFDAVEARIEAIKAIRSGKN